MRLSVLMFLVAASVGIVDCGPASPPDPSPPNQTATPAQSQTAKAARRVAPLETPIGPVTFEPISRLGQKSDVVKLQLREAAVAGSKDWPASFRATFKSTGGESSCTAVLIGPQVLLTAAHCVPESGKISYGRLDTKSTSATCERHGDWVSGADSSADFALCRLDDPYVGPPGFKFETINLARIEPTGASPTAVVLTGFGCIDNKVAHKDKIDKKYRIGLTALIDSSASPTMELGTPYYAADGGEKNNLFTEEEGPNLCPGDSGGPAFLPTGIYSQKQYEHRSIVGINSRVFYADADGTLYGASMISSIGAGNFRSWAEKWLGSLPACGLTGSLPNCRS